MITPPNDPLELTNRLFGMLRNISQFDEIELRPVMSTLINADERTSCYQLIYHRTVAHVASLLVLNNRQHFQAVSMITRGLFELAVDIELMDKVSDAIPKMIVYAEFEKLRRARQIVKYKIANPSIKLDVMLYESFIANNGARIDAAQRKLWPTVKRLTHWSAMDLKQRTDFLGQPWHQIYAIDQPRWSWQVHAGITGIASLKIETFTAICGVALNSCADFYVDILLAIIVEFKIACADSTIRGKLNAARMVAFADDEAEAQGIFRHLTG